MTHKDPDVDMEHKILKNKLMEGVLRFTIVLIVPQEQETRVGL